MVGAESLFGRRAIIGILIAVAVTAVAAPAARAEEEEGEGFQALKLTPTFTAQWGEPGSGAAQFGSPGHEAITGNGTLWVADRTNDRLQEFSAANKWLREAAVSNPTGIAYDKVNNKLYVAHEATSGSCLDQLSATGVLQKSLAQCGTEPEKGQLRSPTGVAVDINSNVWVADANGLHEYSKTGEFIASYSSAGSNNGQVSSPQGIAFDHEDHLFVADYGNNRIDEFTASGTFVRKWGAAGTANGRFEGPYDVAVEQTTGAIAVTDERNKRVQFFTKDGKYDGKFGAEGVESGQFMQPQGVVADSYGHLFVTDGTSDRVEEWTLPAPVVGQPGWYMTQDESPGEGVSVSVNIASGDLMVESEDLPEEEETHYLRLDRFYNTQLVPTKDTLGPRWSWDFGPDVYLIDDGPTVVLHGPSGYVVTLKKAASGTYKGPEEFEGSLVKNADGTFTLTDENNLTYQFTSTGVLTSEANERGETFSVADGALAEEESAWQSVTPATGGSSHASYNALAQLTQTSDPASRLSEFEYGTAGNLIGYTPPIGGKTEYAYNTAGYLDQITMPDGTIQSIVTNNAGKVTELTETPPGGTPAGTRFTYGPPVSPQCKPNSDAGETTLTPVPSGVAEVFCWSKEGFRTGPKTEGDEEVEGTGTPEEAAEGCYIQPEAPEDCGEEDLAPEGYGLWGEGEGELEEESASGLAARDLARSNYGLADNNWILPHTLTKEEEEAGLHPPTPFNYFTDSYIKALGVTKYRRTIPWNMALEAEYDEKGETKNHGAVIRREDTEEWVTKVKALGGQPLISFEYCPLGSPTKPGEWEDPTVPQSKDSEDDRLCTTPPSPAAFKIGLEAFFKRPVLAGVRYFTAWNEPNRPGNPTYEQAGESGKLAELAGKYWAVLDGLCRPTLHNCFVAAGDFLDSFMGDAFHPKNKKGQETTGYHYFRYYRKGMNHPQTAYRWAWHAYSDGAETVKEFKHGRPHHWWRRFHNFLEAINRTAKSTKSKYPRPNIWLTEQGVVYSEGEELKPPWTTDKHEMVAQDIIKAYVDHGANQLTRQTSQIKRFLYYSSRGSYGPGGFDSGLLEVPRNPAAPNQPPQHHTPSTPRAIYYIYKHKTTGH